MCLNLSCHTSVSPADPFSISWLQFLHSKNIIHGDLKPANVMLKVGDPRALPLLVTFLPSPLVSVVA